MGLASTFVALVIHGSSLLPAVPTASSSPVLWYLTRATASAAYVALTLATICGMLRGIARGAGAQLSWVVDELHQVLATCFAGLVVLHLITLYYHTFIPFTLVNFLLPGSQPYRPLAVNLGVLALYTMVIILLSTWFRRHLSYRVWRVLHYLSFATFVLVTLHGLLAGSDAGEAWMRALYAGASAAIGFLVLMRLLTSLSKASAPEASKPERVLPEQPPTEQAWAEPGPAADQELEAWEPLVVDDAPTETISRWAERQASAGRRREEG